MLDDSRVEPVERRPGGDVGRQAPLRGAGTLSAILPNGRVLWLDVQPSPATAPAIDQLAQAAESATAWRRAATSRHSRHIARLATETAAATEGLIEARLARSRALRRRFARSEKRLDRRLSKAAEAARARLRERRRIQMETVRRIRRRDLWDKAVIATSLPLFAAFGQKGRPFSAGHVALVLSTLIWLVGDEVVDALFGSEDKPSKYPVRDTDIWSYIAPIGNLLAGWWLLSDFQNERFVTGHVTVPPELLRPTREDGTDLTYEALVEVDLSQSIAPSSLREFETFQDVPVVATLGTHLLSKEGEKASARIVDVKARVEGLSLLLSVTAITSLGGQGLDEFPVIVSRLELGWMLDTRKPTAVTRPG